MKPAFREMIPVAIVFVFLACAVALVLELLIAGASGRAADGAATTVLGAILTACVPALVALYRLDNGSPPKPPEVEEEPEIGAGLSAAQKAIIKKYLNEMAGVRWRFRST